jgi:general secretion pathway protein L
MRTLIVQLPLGTPSPSTVYPYAEVQTDTPAQAFTLKWAAASLLPTADRQTDVVALVPAQALSWHRVSLPAGLNKPTARRQAALQGLLEDRLLDDPTTLHMALAPDWQRSPQPWVAVCDREWLSAHLQSLESAGLTVHRIAPEFAPTSETLQLHALGDAEQGWLWCSHVERGVWGLPLSTLGPDGQGLWAQNEERLAADVQAEPAVVALVSQRLGLQARLMAPSQHWLTALVNGWDLAQFDFQTDVQNRRFKQAQRAASHFLNHPTWRPVRWGLCLLLATQIVGLNAWAWKTRANWQNQQQSWSQLLKDTFPQTLVVVDAPVQMTQEVARLRQSSGQLAPQDLEAMLAAWGQVLPPNLAAPTAWRYQTGQLFIQDFKASASEQNAITQALNKLGYQWRADGAAWVMRPQEGNP